MPRMIRTPPTMSANISDPESVIVSPRGGGATLLKIETTGPFAKYPIGYIKWVYVDGGQVNARQEQGKTIVYGYSPQRVIVQTVDGRQEFTDISSWSTSGGTLLRGPGETFVPAASPSTPSGRGGTASRGALRSFRPNRYTSLIGHGGGHGPCYGPFVNPIYYNPSPPYYGPIAVLDDNFDLAPDVDVDAIADAVAKKLKEKVSGYEVLGADVTPVLRADKANVSSAIWAVQQQQSAEQEEKRRRLLRRINTILIASLAGGAVGGVGGALLWPAHRIIGFLIGSVIVGSPAGAGVGTAIAIHQESKR